MDGKDRDYLKATNRGKVSEEWHKKNKLTKETQLEFNRLMKSTDKDFDKLTRTK